MCISKSDILNGRSIKNIIGLVMSKLVGMGIKGMVGQNVIISYLVLISCLLDTVKT